MAERYVHFNVPELLRVASVAVKRDRCVTIIKLTEGSFNRIFLLTMDDGYEVIARIPIHVAGPSFYTTASEVATMDFLRTSLDIPVPQVFAWASMANISNPVGAEYIIMEKVQGDSLASRWLSFSTEEFIEVIKQIVDIENRLFSAPFSEYGSLYYKNDIERVICKDRQDERTREDVPFNQFRIGPIATRSFWGEKQDQLTVNHGPCLSLRIY